MKTRDALQMNMAERREKKSRLLHEIRELEQLERVQELNNEINDDSDDIFNQIEIERRKGYQEYIERLTPDSNQSYSEDDEQNISNTTPEPARTPTMFNVNASEFKVCNLKWVTLNYLLERVQDKSYKSVFSHHQNGTVVHLHKIFPQMKSVL